MSENKENKTNTRKLHDSPYIEFSQRLKDLRSHYGYSQAKIASLMSIPTSTYEGYETGCRKANLNFLLKLAKAYDLNLDDLVGMRY